MSHPLRRSASVGLVLALALTLLVGSPRSALAHDSCAIPAPPADGVLGTVLAAVNVFSAFVSAEAECPDKYGDVDVKIARDFAVEAGAESVADRAGARGRGASTYAPCVRGMAAGTFPCDGIDMLAHVSHQELGTTFVNDIWGWTDPQTRKDYALLGASEGTVFVDISRALHPQVLGILPTATTAGGDFWRDIKVYDDHAFVVSENDDHGMQVFDLTRLRDWEGTYTTYDADARYTGHGSAHNININEDTGFAYSVGAGDYSGNDESLCGTGLHMVDINDPENPSFAGCFDGNGYVHDTQCVVYEGPDAEHRGREICFNSNGLSYDTGPTSNYFSIVDVTDKENPETLSVMPYEGSGYSHQGWLTEDQAWFMHGDEGDEILRGVNTTTRVWDVSDLDEPFVDNVFVNDTTSIDHNLYPEGHIAYASNYTTGLRLYDASAPGSGLRELGYFDLYPENDNASFEGGTWSNYSHFRQPRVVAVSSIDRGLFILRPRVAGAR